MLMVRMWSTAASDKIAVVVHNRVSEFGCSCCDVRCLGSFWTKHYDAVENLKRRVLGRLGYLSYAIEVHQFSAEKASR